jgi:hypothetical protein
VNTVMNLRVNKMRGMCLARRLLTFQAQLLAVKIVRKVNGRNGVDKELDLLRTSSLWDFE